MTDTVPAASRRAFLVFCTVAIAGLAISGVGPRDRLTWWLEVAPVIVALPLLAATRSRFPLTWLCYLLIAVHAAILMVGGHYTYAQVPLGFWIQDAFDMARNPYDRIGHFAQGFVPAMLARELLLRHTPLRRGGWLFTLVAGMCLAISACYEFIEWWSALIGGGSAEAFLGTQGDVWDTQWDMFMALVGALVAQLTLARVHDRALSGIAAARRPDDPS
jgi:putative membrane protein